MVRKLFIQTVLISLTVAMYLVTLWLPEQVALGNLFQSFLAISLIYAVLTIGVGEFVADRFSDSKTRYSFRKAISLLAVIVGAVILLRVWVPNPQALLVAYGVVAAGVAVALQDVVKNLAGSIVIFLGGLYRVGNRIELNDTYGDVIDIGLFNTTLLETREWIDGDQATGRMTTVPNGVVLSRPIQNFTKQHSYLWDELSIVVTPESNWGKAMDMLAEIGHEHTKEFIDAASRSLTRLERYYYVEGHVLEPNVYIKPANDGYQLSLRYVVDAWQRRSTNSDIWGHVIRVFEETSDIAIAPTTLAQVEYPKVSQS